MKVCFLHLHCTFEGCTSLITTVTAKQMNICSAHLWSKFDCACHGYLSPGTRACFAKEKIDAISFLCCLHLKLLLYCLNFYILLYIFLEVNWFEKIEMIYCFLGIAEISQIDEIQNGGLMNRKRPADRAFDDDLDQFLNDDFMENSKCFLRKYFCTS